MKSFLNFFLYVFICSCTTSYTTFSFDFIKWQQQCVYCNSPPYRCLAINYQPAMGGVLRTPTGSILASLGYGCFLSEFNTVQPGNATIVEVTPTKQKVWEMHFAPGVLPAPQPALAFIRAKPSRSSCVFAFSDLHLQALPLLNMCDIFVGCFVWRRWCLTPPQILLNSQTPGSKIQLKQPLKNARKHRKKLIVDGHLQSILLSFTNFAHFLSSHRFFADAIRHAFTSQKCVTFFHRIKSLFCLIIWSNVIPQHVCWNRYFCNP